MNRFKKNEKLIPKIYQNDDKFLVILESLNIWGEGKDISEAYHNYHHKIKMAKSKTIVTSENSDLYKEVVWRKRRNALIIILLIISLIYAQIAIFYALAYKFYNVRSLISIVNVINDKLNNISKKDKYLLKNSLDNMSNNLNKIINGD